MTDDDWEQQRQRAILAAFQTGRPVFADTTGEMRHVDGACEPLAGDVGTSKALAPDVDTWWMKIKRRFGRGRAT